MNWPLLQNSLFVSGLATLLASAFGFVVALALAASEPRWRRGLLALTVVALVLPPFLVTNCWLDLLGNNGAWHAWLPLNLYSRGGAIWLLSLLHWPLTTLFVLAAWRRLDRSQLESDPALAGLPLVRWLLGPMAHPAIAQAALLTFVLVLNNFAVPVILQVPVFPEELWLAFTTRLDDEGAWTAAWPLVVAPLAVLFCLRRTAISWPHPGVAVPGRTLRRQLGGTCFAAASVITTLLLVLSVALPLKQLALSARTWTELPNVFRAVPETIGTSFLLAAGVAGICVAIGLLSWRQPIGLIVWLPFLIPGVLLGRLLIFALQGTLIYGTTTLVAASFTLRYLAPAWTAIARARRGVDRDLIDAAQLDGASGWSLWRHVLWPQLGPTTAAAGYVTYLLCLWDVETLVLIQPPGGETLALRIFNLLHFGHNAQVNALCVVLLSLALAPLAAWRIASRSTND